MFEKITTFRRCPTFFVRSLSLSYDKNIRLSKLNAPQNLHMELKGFQRSNASNRKTISCTVSELCPVKFEKKAISSIKNDTLHILHFRANGWNIRAKNLLIKLENSKESNVSNRKAISRSNWKLCLVKFEKKLFLSQKWHLPTYSSSHTKRIQHPLWKFVCRTKRLEGI